MIIYSLGYIVILRLGKIHQHQLTNLRTFDREHLVKTKLGYGSCNLV